MLVNPVKQLIQGAKQQACCNKGNPQHKQLTASAVAFIGPLIHFFFNEQWVLGLSKQSHSLPPVCLARAARSDSLIELKQQRPSFQLLNRGKAATNCDEIWQRGRVLCDTLSQTV
jgi:hypothetical protein